MHFTLSKILLLFHFHLILLSSIFQMCANFHLHLQELKSEVLFSFLFEELLILFMNQLVDILQNYFKLVHCFQ